MHQQVDGAAHHAVAIVAVADDCAIFQQKMHQLLDGLHEFRSLVKQRLVALAVTQHSVHNNEAYELSSSQPSQLKDLGTGSYLTENESIVI